MRKRFAEGRSWDLLIVMVVAFAAAGGAIGGLTGDDPGCGAGAGGIVAALVHMALVAWSETRLLPPSGSGQATWDTARRRS